MIEEQREEPGKKYALAFTILVHVGLLVVLFFGVQWKRSAPVVMEVELWSAQPVPATYVPPPPPPPEPVLKPEPKPEPKPVPKVEPKPEPPKKPDIVIKEEKKKPEPKKPEPKPEPKKPEPEPKKPEAKPQPKFDFDKELARETSALRSKNNPSTQRLANAAAAESEQRASANRRGLADYANKIRLQIRSNMVVPPNIQGNPEAVFEVNQLPSREILSVKLKRSSGNQALDEAIERAIRKSSPLPAPDDPSLFKRDLEIRYRPFEE